jgi:hypothetical protein
MAKEIFFFGSREGSFAAESLDGVEVGGAPGGQRDGDERGDDEQSERCAKDGERG